MPIGWMALDLASIVSSAEALHSTKSLTDSMIKISADSSNERSLSRMHSSQSSIDLEGTLVASSGGGGGGGRTRSRRSSFDTMSLVSMDRLSLSTYDAGDCTPMPGPSRTSTMGSRIEKKKSSLDSAYNKRTAKEVFESQRPWREMLKGIQPLVVNVSSFYRQVTSEWHKISRNYYRKI